MEWAKQALCREVDPDLFFPRPGENDRVNAARRVCRRCEVQSECLSWALDLPDMQGIVGGTTERERIVLRRRLKVIVA